MLNYTLYIILENMYETPPRGGDLGDGKLP